MPATSIFSKTASLPTDHQPLTTHPLLTPGSLTLLLGNPGVGKSLLALNLATHLSRGTLFPPPALSSPPTSAFNPSSSLLLSAEDTQQTLHARAAAMHADTDFLHILPNPNGNILIPIPPNTEGQLLLALRKFIAQSGDLRLLILDPLPAFLGTHDCSHQGTIRKLLQPLLALAEKHAFSILGITHLNKSPTPKNRSHHNPLHKAIGSLAYTALARSVHLVTPDDRILPSRTTDHDPRATPLPRRLIIPLKQNLTQSPHAYAFTLLPGPTLEWDPTPITDHPLLPNTPIDTQPEPADLATRSQLDFAKYFLTTTLAHGPILSAQLLKQARSLGITNSTLNRARALLEICVYHDGITNQWYSRLSKPQKMPNF